MNEQDLLLIERNYRGELDAAERVVFEQRLETDPAFREEVRLHQQAMQAIRLHGKELLKRKLQERLALEPDHRTFSWWWAVVIVALVAISLGLYWWMRTPASAPHVPVVPSGREVVPTDTLPASPSPGLQASPNPRPTEKKTVDPENLFAQAYRPYRDEAPDGTVRSGNPGPDTAQVTGLNLVKQLAYAGKYAESLAAFETLSPAIQRKPPAQFFLANNLLALGRTPEAAVLFEKVAMNGQTGYAASAQWYAALCALKTKDLPKARKWLETLANGSQASSSQRSEAKRLLDKLR